MLAREVLLCEQWLCIKRHRASQYTTDPVSEVVHSVGHQLSLPEPCIPCSSTCIGLYDDSEISASAFVSRPLNTYRAGLFPQVPFTSQGPGVCDPTNTTGTPPWWIPLPFISSTVSSLDWSSQLDTCVGGMTINTASGTEWVKLNAGQYGFYRVNYTESMWAQLATAAGVSNGGGTVLGSEDVAGLLDDAYQLSRGGQLSITVYLDLIRSACTALTKVMSYVIAIKHRNKNSGGGIVGPCQVCLQSFESS